MTELHLHQYTWPVCTRSSCLQGLRSLLSCPSPRNHDWNNGLGKALCHISPSNVLKDLRHQQLLGMLESSVWGCCRSHWTVGTCPLLQGCRQCHSMVPAAPLWGDINGADICSRQGTVWGWVSNTATNIKNIQEWPRRGSEPIPDLSHSAAFLTPSDAVRAGGWPAAGFLMGIFVDTVPGSPNLLTLRVVCQKTALGFGRGTWQRRQRGSSALLSRHWIDLKSPKASPIPVLEIASWLLSQSPCGPSSCRAWKMCSGLMQWQCWLCLITRAVLTNCCHKAVPSHLQKVLQNCKIWLRKEKRQK